MAKFWSVKYLFTGGVLEREGELVNDSLSTGKKYVSGRAPGVTFQIFERLGTDIFESEAEANAAAKKMCDKKVAALEKQIQKIEKIKYKFK